MFDGEFTGEDRATSLGGVCVLRRDGAELIGYGAVARRPSARCGCGTPDRVPDAIGDERVVLAPTPYAAPGLVDGVAAALPE